MVVFIRRKEIHALSILKFKKGLLHEIVLSIIIQDI